MHVMAKSMGKDMTSNGIFFFLYFLFFLFIAFISLMPFSSLSLFKKLFSEDGT